MIYYASMLEMLLVIWMDLRWKKNTRKTPMLAVICTSFNTKAKNFGEWITLLGPSAFLDNNTL